MATDRFRVFGVNVESTWRFRTSVMRTAAPPNLTLERHTVSALYPDKQGAEYRKRLFASEHTGAGGGPLLCLYRDRARFVLSYRGFVDFHLGDRRIRVEALSETDSEHVEAYFLGVVMALWLGLKGRTVFHASVVELRDMALAFLGPSHAGKSCIAAALIERGAALMSDDVLCAQCMDRELLAQPGYPQMRVWPDIACRFVADPERLPRVLRTVEKRAAPVGVNGVFGSFCCRAAPLARLYLLRRSPDECLPAPSVSPVAAATAVPRLIGSAMLIRMGDSAGFAPQRFQAAADLAERVPVRELSYPSSLDALPTLAAAVEEDAMAPDAPG